MDDRLTWSTHKERIVMTIYFYTRKIQRSDSSNKNEDTDGIESPLFNSPIVMLNR